MIPKNLKVGDKFTDGNRTFEVLSVEGNGVYISKCVGVNVKPEYTNETVKEEPKKDTELDSFNDYTKTEINRLNVSELEKVCEKLGLEKSTGMAMKKAIIEKLGL